MAKNKKKIEGYLKIIAPAGKASPSPPIGPALGQRGINIMEFCKTFNDKTQNMEQGLSLPTIITIFQDKSFNIEIKTPLTSYFLKKAAGVDKGSALPGRESKGSVTNEQLREIAEMKMKDLNARNIEQAVKIVAGAARSMGIKVAET